MKVTKQQIYLGLHSVFIPSTLTPYIDTVFSLDWVQFIEVNT